MNPASEQYHQRALAFQKANPGMVFVVRGSEHGEQVRAWFTYFHSRGQVGTISVFRQLLSGKGAVQFPCERPEHFDPSYIAPVHQWREPDDGPQSRRDMSQVAERTLEGLRSAVPRGRQSVPKSHLAEPEMTPGEWLSDYKNDPPPVPVFSDEFRAKHGLPPRKSDAAA
jgi:hypothetical protein